jgi:hypothetical protein
MCVRVSEREKKEEDFYQRKNSQRSMGVEEREIKT